ncbi:flagellar basal body L-ring protein FlgH [Solimonas sp. K1W22B-7]|nr:flagellar basal body L-ring protein FlgH [Solimonas sp. K1W22B-7]
MQCLLPSLVLMLAHAPVLHADNLYDEKNFRALAADVRARDVGDPVTVLIVENSSAESRANSSEDASFSLNAGIKDATGPASAGLDIESNSDGAAHTARGGNLRAQVSARVEKKLDNGNLFIRGRQRIRVNGEEQEIKLEGVVRPVDIAGANVVLSTRIMDAKIEYSGQGWVSRTQNPGIFLRFLQFLGL